MEITTGIGRLIKIEHEPIYNTKEELIKDGWLENENPMQTVYTLSLIFDDNREFRWTNRKFIKVKEITNEARDIVQRADANSKATIAILDGKACRLN